jgi:hypothetical protein
MFFLDLNIEPLESRKMRGMLLSFELCGERQRTRFTLVYAVLQRFAAP